MKNNALIYRLLKAEILDVLISALQICKNVPEMDPVALEQVMINIAEKVSLVIINIINIVSNASDFLNDFLYTGKFFRDLPECVHSYRIM